MTDMIKKDEKKVEYLELIYDLIFVYVIGRNNSLLHDIINGFVTGSTFIAYILCSLAIIQIWNFSTCTISARAHVPTGKAISPNIMRHGR